MNEERNLPDEVGTGTRNARKDVEKDYTAG